MKRTKLSGKNNETQKRQVGRRQINDIPFDKQNSKANILHLLVIVILSLIVFYPAMRGDITNWDDSFYIKENPYIQNLSQDNVKAIFKKRSFMGNYHPLTILSLALDYKLSDKKPDGTPEPFVFHLVNLLLHIGVSLLVYFIVLNILKNDKAALLAGILFAVHTLHVESVAWLSERKDVLYAFFFMASLLAYIRYVIKKHWGLLLLSFMLFILSLLSKGQAVSLAVTLIVIDIFYKRNLTSVKLWAEKLPYLLLSLFFGILAIKAQQQGEALVLGEGYPFLQRISVAAYGFTMYILKLILPINLSAMYPYPDIINRTVPIYYTLSILIVLGVAFGFWKSLKKYPVIALGIAIFAVNIALLLQLIPVGSAIYADRYAYIPSLGFFLIVAWFAQHSADRFVEYKKYIFIATSLYIIVLGALTFQRSKIWQNSMILWNDTIEKSPDAVVARNNRGSLKNEKAQLLSEKNQIDQAIVLWKEAINDFDIAIKVKPDYTHAFYNRGATKFELGRQIKDTALFYEAMADFNKALEFDTLFHAAYHYRANVFGELNQLEMALSDFEYALRLQPNNPDYLISRGVNFGKMGRLPDAVSDLTEAIRLNPDNFSAYGNLGRAYAGMGKYEKAIELYNKALEINPDFIIGKYNKAVALWKLQRNDEAISEFSKLIEADPNFADAYFMRAQVYVQIKNSEAACADFSVAAKMGNLNAKQFLVSFCNN